MKIRAIISIILLGMGLIIAAVPQNTTLPYKLTADQLLKEANNSVLYYSPEEVAQLIIQKDPEFQLVDVRPQNEFEKFSLPNAINIPLNDLLADDYRDILDQGVKRNIFYSNGTSDALKAWMITRQLGWENNYVLQGGLNYWAEVILNPTPPPNVSANDEILKYQFRKAAGQALSGGAAVEQTATPEAPAVKPPIQRTPKRKRVQGGC